MSPARVLLVIHAAATFFMTGVIWFVQVVHYPLFSRVGFDWFPRYESEHTNLVAYVVAAPMILELVTAGALFLLRPSTVHVMTVSFGFVLLIVIWVSTFFVQVPAHGMLSNGFDVNAWEFLVKSNWVRTLAWTARGGLAGYWLMRS